MELFKPKDFLKANPKLGFLGGEHFARFLMLMLRFDKLNMVYNKIGHKKGLDFVEELLAILSINYAFDSEVLLKRIPKSGQRRGKGEQDIDRLIRKKVIYCHLFHVIDSHCKSLNGFQWSGEPVTDCFYFLKMK